jgi:phosphate transport system permease protein
MRAWPRVASLGLGLIPVAMLAYMVATLVIRSVPAFTDEKVGFTNLFSTHFSSIYTTGAGQFGLVPALWATLMVAVISIGLAFPMSLAIAVFASEMAPGFVGRAMRTMLGVMSGVPPIIYAVTAGVFLSHFMMPKFTADSNFASLNADPSNLGYTPDTWPPPGVPWNPGSLPWSLPDNSTLLGGILLALLVIPFMAPLIEDALRNVPNDPKQASLALGAGRWYTLRRITLPQAMGGIISALRLGALKALGDVMIAAFIIGFESQLPNPLWDAFERSTPLTSTGAGLVGGFTASNTCQGPRCDVAYVSGVMLMVIALLVVLVCTLLERRFRRQHT